MSLSTAYSIATDEGPLGLVGSSEISMFEAKSMFGLVKLIQLKPCVFCIHYIGKGALLPM